jgi:hypothetical protein
VILAAETFAPIFFLARFPWDSVDALDLPRSVPLMLTVNSFLSLNSDSELFGCGARIAA